MNGNPDQAIELAEEQVNKLVANLGIANTCDVVRNMQMYLAVLVNKELDADNAKAIKLTAFVNNMS
tara:strand:- start:1118 stop:1315 length:198 start_codon:yes stop_codon:yes gene_type:complete